MVKNWSIRLEKHQTIDFLRMLDFLRIFKMLDFLKILRDLPIFGDHCFTTIVHFQFQCESLKKDFVALCFCFVFSILKNGQLRLVIINNR